VIKRILQRSYYDNDLIFVRAAISTEYIEPEPPIYRSYYPNVDGERECFARLFRDFGWSRPFAILSATSITCVALSRSAVAGRGRTSSLTIRSRC